MRVATVLTALAIFRIPPAAVTTLPTTQSASCVTPMARLTIFALAAATIVQLGCHRQYYRRQATDEAYCLIDEKSGHISRPPQTPLRIDVSPESRMFNPFDPDFQPMPLDDPSSHRYMQCVDGRRGYPMWKAAGITNTVENPDWWQNLPLNEDGVLVLDADTAVRLALMNSPDYQRQLEQLFLSALDVSSERFRFDTQFFGGSGASFANSNSRLNGTTTSSSTTTNLNTVNGQMNRTFATGATLVTSLANDITWQLSGPNTQQSRTLLDFSLIQPLLRGAGRDRVLETLTRSERQLLANVRSFERYRRSFYLNVVTGRTVESTVQRSGGVFGVGLGGFTGLGGGLVGLGGGNTGVGGNGGVAQAGGFLGLLQDQLQIRNLEENVGRQAENLTLLEDTLIELLTTIPDDPEEIVRQRLQVTQARSSLLNAQSSLITTKAAYQASIDSFMGTLGLPPYICAQIQDPMLERFELIDRKLRSRREELVVVRNRVGAINIEVLSKATVKVEEQTGLPQSQLVWTPQIAEQVRLMRKELQPLADFNRTLLETDLLLISEDIKKLAAALPERESQNQDLLALYRKEQKSICSLLNVSEIDESIFDLQGLNGLVEELEADYAELEKRLATYQDVAEKLDKALEKLATDGPESDDPGKVATELRDNVILASQDLLADVSDDVLAMQLIQARARTEAVVLPQVNIEPAEALEIARRNRRDWANARASLVDQWRLIEFNADNLESSLDVTFSGGLASTDSNPTNLLNTTETLRLGLRWDAPLTRLQERNSYRQTLIDYEQAKRSFYRFEDGVWQLLRAEIRQLQTNRLNFELGRQSVRIAAAQLELNEDIRGIRDARGLSSGPTAARDTIQAFSDLLNAQNQLLNVFVNFELVRRSLDLDLGTMELTPEGMWLDPGPISPENLLGLSGTSEPGMLDCNGNCCLTMETMPTEAIFGNAGQMMTAMEIGQLTSEIQFEELATTPLVNETVEPSSESDMPISGMPESDMPVTIRAIQISELEVSGTEATQLR